MQRPTLIATDYKTSYVYALNEKTLQIEKIPHSGKWELREMRSGVVIAPLAQTNSPQQAYDTMLQLVH